MRPKPSASRNPETVSSVLTADSDDWACFEGLCGDAQAHRHLSAQVVVGLSGPARVRGAGGDVVGEAVLVAPGVLHAIVPSGQVGRIVYIQSFGRLAQHWGVAAWPLTPQAAQTPWACRLRGPNPGLTLTAESSASETRSLDPRLATALQTMRQATAYLDLGSVARSVGLSRARLRALAQAELGAPLAHWRAWLQLERALGALRRGENLAAAAALGGFSDQSHFSRTMRRFFGITPQAASRLLRAPRAA